MITRRTLFGLTAGAAASAVAPATVAPAQPPRINPLTGHPITLMGEHHNHMSRETLIEFVEALDWHIANLQTPPNSSNEVLK